MRNSCLIKNFHLESETIIIDYEYPGKEKQIIDFLIDFGKKANLKLSGGNFRFRRIGKKSKAHEEAHLVYKGKRKAKKIISLREIISLLP